MKTRFLIIIGIAVIIFLLIAVAYPTINYKTWGNNELFYWNDENPDGMVCDEKLWQSPSNCKPKSSIEDSEKILNAGRDAKLAAGYKLYPGVGWVHPDDQGNQEPIYRDNPNNPGELILDLDAMIRESDTLNLKGCPQFCSEKVANNVFSFCGGDGFYSEGYMFTNNSTHYFDHNGTCEWTPIYDSEHISFRDFTEVENEN